jgi:hypothetical protein
MGVAAAIAGFVFWVRGALYIGPPRVAGEIAAGAVPVLGNEVHLSHNVGQFFVHNWAGGRTFITIGLLSGLAALAVCKRQGNRTVAVWWSLAVVGTIFCFGYVNETRLYFPLLAFWCVYAWPSPALDWSPDEALHAP